MQRRHLEELRIQISELESHIPVMAVEKPDISKANVGWHISHSFKVIEKVTAALENSDSRDFRRSFNLKRLLVFSTGRIPRGKARSPKAVLPEENLSEEVLLEQISQAKQKIFALDNLPKRAFFEHPFFDHLNRDQTFRFLVIHTRHHLRIIREILLN